MTDSSASETGADTMVPTQLNQLASEIKAEVAAADADFQSAVQHAINAGAKLAAAKRLVDHGKWLPWLKVNFPGSQRTAQTYMRLAENAQRVADLPTVREAVAALTERTAPRSWEQAMLDTQAELQTFLKTIFAASTIFASTFDWMRRHLDDDQLGQYIDIRYRLTRAYRHLAERGTFYPEAVELYGLNPSAEQIAETEAYMSALGNASETEFECAIAECRDDEDMSLANLIRNLAESGKAAR